MLHEIILNLLCPNTKYLDEQIESTEVNAFLHPSEKSLIRRVLGVAKYFAASQTFIESVINKVGEDGNEGSNGIYMRAFASGIEKELIPYRREVIDMQQKTLQDPFLTLSELQCTVTKHYTLLKTYSSIINQVQNRQLKGCQVLQLIYESSTCGDEQIKQSLNRILQQCHIAFFKQLLSWLLYGHLHDRCNEFFIQPVEPEEINANDAQPNRLPVDTITAFQFFIEFNTTPDIKKYNINVALVPSYISFSLAQKILFIGETVLILRSQYANIDKKMELTNSVYDGKEKDFTQKLTQLQQGAVFRPYELEKAIDQMRSSVMEYLWKLAISESDLYGQLQLIKNFYLLSHGELFIEFLRKVDSILYKTITNTTERILNYSMLQAVQSIGLNESILSKFEFVVPDKKSVLKESNVFNFLKLEYKTQWPLQLLFTPEVLHNYNAIFLFLLRIKKIQIDLHNVWLIDVKKKEKLPWNIAWQLRTRLMFLIDNLQYYLQVDVLETEFSNLIKSANKVKDFEKVQQMHSVFLAKVLTHSFVSFVQVPQQKSTSSDQDHEEMKVKMKPHPVNACLMNIFKICEKFIVLMPLEDSPALEKELQMLLDHFNQQLGVLIVSMSSLTSRNTSYKHLNQFILRLDYNNWFTNKFDLREYLNVK